MASFCVHGLAILSFGFAVKFRSTHIAPRCEARPRNVIYNPDPRAACQDRGNPWLGWVPWVLKLSYEDMIKGIEGTGTREGGLSGSMLRVNMDNIVMLRFHSYCLRVSTLAFFVYTLVLLPVYWTAGCSDQMVKELCVVGNKTLTNYDRTTLANIVPATNVNATELIGLSARLYAVVFCSWLVTWYACYELKQEWVDVLAMRRFYFLESDHWKDRQQDFEQTVMLSQSQHSEIDSISPDRAPTRRRRRMKRMKLANKETDYVRDRDPWIPHPELRDTPPAVALYSVLVGGVPSMPAVATENKDGGPDIEANADRESANREWQLSVTSAFFDHCIPNQPGFSSSVAAVTILPHANELAKSWRKWYVAAAKLRRLRFIRKQIRMKRHYDIDVYSDVNDADEDEEARQAATPPPLKHAVSQSAYNDQTAAPRADYNREVFGSAMDDDVEELLMEALDFGPEQTAVYSRELAQSASPCCPNGCFEGAVVQARIDELLELEQIALEEVEVANLELQAARQNAVLNSRTKDTKNGAEKATMKQKEKEKKEKGRDSIKDKPTFIKPKLSKAKSVLLRDDLPIGVVKNFIEHDTVKNLLGRDASVPNDNNTLADRRPAQTAGNNKFDLEAKLLSGKSGPFQLGNSSHNSSHSNEPANGNGRRQTAVSSGSAGSVSSSSDEDDSSQQRQSYSRIPSIKEEMYQPADKPEPRRSWNGHNGHQMYRLDPLSESVASHPYQRPASFRGRAYSGSEASFRADTVSSYDRGSFRVQKRRLSKRPSIASYGPSDAWALVDAIALDSQEPIAKNDEAKDKRKSTRVLSGGNWELSSLTDFLKMLGMGVFKFLRWTTVQSLAKSNEAVDLVAADATYAVVTFTSRQAAVAARKVLADGRGSTRWQQLDTLPIPPLADAAACDLLTCRGCCRPVTLSINDRQKKWRWYLSMGLLATIYVFWTFPLTFLAGFANSENLNAVFPGLQDLKDTYLTAELLSSLIVALLYAGFLAICPVLFKTIANFGSNANSTVEAEFSALKYFWWFMVVSAFSGTLLQSMILDGFTTSNGVTIGNELQEVLTTIAATIPSEISPLWINWIIVKTSVTAPLMYMLQLNTFLLDWAQLKCCERAVRGGGPGGPLPYRIYVDSGYVLLCVFALAPAAPLVAPFAFLYFLFSTPMLRRGVIFMYRPKFDAGGVRFPFLFEMCISGMFVGQLLLAIMMGLKKSLGPSVLAASTFVPTLFFRDAMRARYLRAFNDVGLLQTSLLDGWDTASPECMETREERRRFLVDSHKAAYVPVCMASSLTMEVLTAEPAVVVPTIQETESELNIHNNSSAESPMKDISMADVSRRESMHIGSGPKQFGATLRRASTILVPPLMMDEMEVKFDEEDDEDEYDYSESNRDYYDCFSEREDNKQT